MSKKEGKAIKALVKKLESQDAALTSLIDEAIKGNSPHLKNLILSSTDLQNAIVHLLGGED
jgi:hypothetical protein